MNVRCRYAWLYWLSGNAALFSYLEWRAYRRGCHKTLSRELQAWTRCKRHRWTPVVFVGLGGWLTAHLITLKELEDV